MTNILDELSMAGTLNKFLSLSILHLVHLKTGTNHEQHLMDTWLGGETRADRGFS